MSDRIVVTLWVGSLQLGIITRMNKNQVLQEIKHSSDFEMGYHVFAGLNDLDEEVEVRVPVGSIGCMMFGPYHPPRQQGRVQPVQGVLQ